MYISYEYLDTVVKYICKSDIHSETSLGFIFDLYRQFFKLSRNFIALNFLY